MPEQRNELKLVHIDAFDLNDAWFQCVNNILDYGHMYIIDQGSFAGSLRLEFDYVTVRIKNPGNRPIIPTIPEGSPLPAPTDIDYVEKYFTRYLMSDIKEPKEDYTYGERIHNPKIRIDDCEIVIGKNQLDAIVEKFVKGGFNTNQTTMEIGMPSDVSLVDPPCMRLIDTRIRYNKLHFMPYFRSWDLWSGFPSNLAGLQLMKEYMVNEINSKLEEAGKPERIEDGEIIAASKGLHLYEYVWELAELRTMKKSNLIPKK